MARARAVAGRDPRRPEQRGDAMAVRGLATSPSTDTAVRWAVAAGRHRSGGGTDGGFVQAGDLLVGALLAHPDDDGELAVLLRHFGLTARDVLPEDYPPVGPDDLQRWGADLPDDPTPLLDPGALSLFDLAVSMSEGGTVRLPALVGALLSGTSELQTAVFDALRRAGADPSAVLVTYEEWWREELAATKGGESAAGPPGVGGTRLRRRLAEEHPRSPVELPTYLPDRSETFRDHVGVAAEIDAFAYLLASRTMQPPLAVGLFGDWGSGKSFFMRGIRRRIDQITAQVAGRSQREVRFWKNTAQIEFNAWQYVQGELWASLADHIFRALGPEQAVGRAARVRGEVEQEQETAADRQAAERRRKRRLRREHADAEEQLDRLRRRRDDARHQARARGDQLLDRAAREHARSALADVLGGRADELLDGGVDELRRALTTARTELERGRALLGSYWTGRRIAVAALAAFLVPAVVVGLERLGVPDLMSAGGGLAAAVGAVTAGLRAVTDWTRRRLDDVERVREQIEAGLRAHLAPLDAELEAKQAELGRLEAEIADAAAAERDAGQRADRAAERLVELTPGRILGDFLVERSTGDDYRPYLGLLSVVREHLSDLEELIADHNDDVVRHPDREDAQVNRIILYIDDLDRCPADKVLEVLEAVHLLLAFEPFVVVVAVDERWLTHALTTELSSLAVDGSGPERATPHDYLEKIFQVPFWIRPLAPDARRRLIHRLLEGSVARGGGTGDGDGQATPELTVGEQHERILDQLLSHAGSDPWIEARRARLTEDDLAFAEGLAPLLGDTPRRVKRFINVYQLVCAIPGGGTPSPENGPRASPTDREVVGFLAAVQDGMPELAGTLFDRIAQSDEEAPEPLSAAAAALDGAGDGAVPAEQTARLRAWLGDNPAWDGVALHRLRPRLEIVRRVTFTAVPDGQPSA